MPDFRPEDGELARMAQQGDMNAFRCLVNRYKEKTVRIAFSISGNLADAQDIAQEAFIRAYKNMPRFEFRAQFYTWFYRILINLCRDFLRQKRGRTVPLEQENENGKKTELPLADKSQNPAKILADKELSARMDTAVAQLSEKQRIAFVLKHKQGISVPEISAIMGISPATVKVHLFRAMHELRKKLQPYVNPQGQSGGFT